MTHKLTVPSTSQKTSLARALERRFGQSTMPYVFECTGASLAEGPHWKVTDTETGSYVKGVFWLGRLQVRRWYDGATLDA